MIAFGLLGWAAGLPAAIVASGAAMALLGVFVAVRFPEDNFTPVQVRRWTATLRVLKRGVALARRDREILLVLAATMAVNGADMISWLFARRLVDLGLPGDPVISYAAIGILSSAAGMKGTVLEARPDGTCLAEFAFTPQTEESNGDFVQGILSRGQYEIIES